MFYENIFGILEKLLHKVKAVLLIWRSIGSKMYLFPQLYSGSFAKRMSEGCDFFSKAKCHRTALSDYVHPEKLFSVLQHRDSESSKCANLRKRFKASQFNVFVS